MKPEEWYRELISTITEPDVKRMASIMLSHVGEENAIELRQIALEAFGEYTTATERKTRIILERLVTEHGFAIGAYSGKSGLCTENGDVSTNPESGTTTELLEINMRQWIKLHIEILDDPKMGRMPDRLFRRTIELFLLAGKSDNNEGVLPPIEDIAWLLRVDEAVLLDDLYALQALDIVHEIEPGIWVVTHFSERQDPDTPAERVAKHRKNVTKRYNTRNEDVTKRYKTSNDVETKSYVEVEEDKEEDKESEAEAEAEAETETETETEVAAAAAAVAAADFQSAVQEKREKPFAPKTEREKQAEIGAVFREYEANIGALTPMIADRIGDLIDHYPRDWISAAFREAVAHEARNLKYVEAILKRWETDGFRSSSKQKQNGRKPRDNPSQDKTSQPTPEDILADLEEPL
jgi:DnaD/phage-associated family protein